jgi:hypothetical protein
VENVAMNYQWVSSTCSGIGKPDILDTLCRDSRLHFLYDPGKNAWIGTDDAWTNKAVTDIYREELIANLQSATNDAAFWFLQSHLSGFPTSVPRVSAIRNVILAKLNVSLQCGWVYYCVSSSLYCSSATVCSELTFPLPLYVSE